MNMQAEARSVFLGRHRARRLWWTVSRVWRGVRWPTIAVFAVAAFVLGSFGFDAYLDARGVLRSFWDKAYLSLQLFGVQSGFVDPPVPWQLHVARLLAPLVATYAAVSAFAALFREQITTARVRWFAHDHVVVCGLGRTGHLLTKRFTDLDHRVVAIEKDPTSSAIGPCREGGATVLIGDAGDRMILARARVDRARYVFAVSPDDGANAQVAIDARELVRDRRGAPLTCFIQILDDELAELMEAEIADRPTSTFRLELFNPAERGVPALLDRHPPFDERGNTPFGPPHLLVVGLGQMGSRFVVRAARRWWGIVGANGARLSVTVVDHNASENIESLELRHPRVEKVCEFIPLECDVHSAEFERGEFLIGPEGQHVTGAYVCLGDDARGLAAAIRLQRRLKDRRVSVVVRTKQHGGLASMLEDEAQTYDHLRVFPLLDLTCRPEVAVMGRTEAMARAIHEDYVEKQRAAGETPETNRNTAEWAELSEDIRESNRRQADDIPRKLRDIDCRIEPLTEWTSDTFAFRRDERRDEVEALAEREHMRWWEERKSAKWRYAPVKRRKRSPYMVPWEKLSEEIRELDRNAVRGIPSVLARAGYQVVRLQEEARHVGETSA